MEAQTKDFQGESSYRAGRKGSQQEARSIAMEAATEVMTGAKRKEEEQKAERRARKPVEEMKGEGKMQHRPG